MNRCKTAEEYIAFSKYHTDVLIHLRNIMLKTELGETIKWGSPVYTWNNKNVVGLGSFKSYAGLWFFQGVFLKDNENMLINAQKDKTKALRQWRFRSLAEIDENLVLDYVNEAIENARLGKEVKPGRNVAFLIPVELNRAMQEDDTLSDAFHQLSKSKQREFAEYIGGAKRDETRQNRLMKSIPLIREKKGLNDQYR